MGVDIEIKARVALPFSDEEVADLTRRFTAEFPPYYTAEDGDYYPHLDWDHSECGGFDKRIFDDKGVPDTLHIGAFERYYGPGYERGPWPTIKAYGDWLMVQLGERGRVRYGSDAGDRSWESMEPWEEVRVTIQAHYDAVGHDPYYDKFYQ